MSAFRPARLLFDVNACGPPTVTELSRLLAMQRAQPDEAPELIHVFDFQNGLGLGEEGVWDEHWLPEAASQGWTIFTGDRGKGGIAKGRKLTRLCEEHGATAVLLSDAVQHRRSFAKFLTILSVWHELVDIASAAPGSRYLLEPSGPAANHRGRGKLSIRRSAAPPQTPLDRPKPDSS